MINAVLHIIELTEELLEEAVYQLKLMRPAVTGISMAYRAGHVDPLLRTVGQLHPPAALVSLVLAPVEALRGVITANPQRTVDAAETKPSTDARRAPLDFAGVPRWLTGLGGTVMAVPSWLADLLGRRTPAQAFTVGPTCSPPHDNAGSWRLAGLEVRFNSARSAGPRASAPIPLLSIRLPELSIRLPDIGIAVH